MRRLIRARINTHALRANLDSIKARAPGARVMAVIKANAYGHGLVPTALALAGADAFAVARLEEAAALRAASINAPIVLLEGVFSAHQLSEAGRLGLDLVIHEALQIELLEQAGGTHRYALWLKVDTGMNRLGFRPEQFAEAWRRLPALRPAPLQVRVMTHLARADEPRGAGIDAQLARFWPLVADLGAELSIANSAAILSAPDCHVQWLRPGLALYGVSPFRGGRGRAHGLQAAMTLESTVIAVRQLQVGEAVGYGGAWRATRPARIAIVAAGYGDGLPRSLPGGAPVLINGQRAQLAGRVSMDMIGVDVTELAPVAVGDTAQLWGEALGVEEVAAAAGTIPYELLCGVSQRVPMELL